MTVQRHNPAYRLAFSINTRLKTNLYFQTKNSQSKLCEFFAKSDASYSSAFGNMNYIEHDIYLRN